MNKDRKSTVKKSVFAVIILALLLALIGGTYARYISTATGSGNVDIAKWAVKVGENDISNGTVGSFELTFTTDSENKNVVANKIAPGITATAQVEVDLTGTEVAVDFDCALGSTATEKLTAIFGADYADKVEVNAGAPVLQDGVSNMTLSSDKKVVEVGSAAMSGKVIVPITLTWNNADANNGADTQVGADAFTTADKSKVTVPVDLTVKQHIETEKN